MRFRAAWSQVKWDWLYDLLAKRTSDESGDYIVSEFPIKTMEYWNDVNVDGRFDIDTEKQEYPAIPGSNSTEGLTLAEADTNYVLKVSPGEAYVQGYEVGFRNPIYVYGKKARSESFRSNTLTQFTEGYNVTLTNLSGTPDFQNITGDGTSLAFDELVMFRNFVDGFVGEGVDVNGRPLNLGNSPWTTYHVIVDGNIGTDATGYTEIYKQGNSAVVASNTAILRGDTLGDATVLAATEITTPSRCYVSLLPDWSSVG